MNLKFHHIGIATINIENAIKKYELLGYSFDNRLYEDKYQDVKIAFLRQKGHPLIEVITPLSLKSHLHNIIRKIGSSPYHTCYEVENLKNTIDMLRKNNFIIIQPPIEAVAFSNKRISFLFNKDIGIIELLES